MTDRHLFVILGGTGDLTRRKLVPALFHLVNRGGLAGRFVVLGAASSDLDDEAYRKEIRSALEEEGLASDEAGRWCDDSVFYQRVAREPDSYGPLAERIAQLDREHDLGGNRIFYLALPPQAFPTVIEALGAAGLNHSPGWTRLVIEKPFGHDLESAEQLNRIVHGCFAEEDVYRIDHYLGKETVQNLLIFRFANSLFEASWNRDRVDHVQITVAESLGVEGRAGFYDRVGALRDIVQNHLAQVLTLVAMEPPVRFEAEAIRNEKLKVLRAIRPFEPGDVAYGQYAAGTVDGLPVPGYLEEPQLDGDSQTETAVALRIHIDNWRWQGVPFYLRTGKRLPTRRTDIAVTFREPPVCLFMDHQGCDVHGNVLLITLQPDEGFELLFDVKTPGEPLDLETRPLSFRYADVHGDLPDAYETLLLDVMTGDQTLFVRADEVEQAWRLFDPVVEHPPPPEPYAAGTWGPPGFDELPSADGRTWRTG